MTDASLDYALSRAILFGTATYANMSSVPPVANSLARMEGLLTSDLCGWPQDRVSVFKDERVPGDLPHRLVQLFHKVQDVALFYFVGHGLVDPWDELCLGLVESSTETQSRKYTSLPLGAVRDAFRHSRARAKILILDCCHAGLAVSNTLAPGEIRLLTGGTGACTLAAASEWGRAWFELDDVENPQTYFTKYFADVIERGIPGEGDRLTLGAIFHKAKEALVRDGMPEPASNATDDVTWLGFARNVAATKQRVTSFADDKGRIGSAFPSMTEIGSAATDRTLLPSTRKLLPSPPKLVRRGHMNVWEWFEVRSFHYKDFSGIARRDNTAHWPTTTLIIPARNVADSIGTILDIVSGLRVRTGLPDQVLVVDADSPDGTAGIARSHGAEVYSENELMPSYGPAQGKGDAMWRALSVARGDIVMFADADTADFGEHFVYGTLGPLLADPGIHFSNAAYRRPFTQGANSIANGGGRVTELMAKPLLNLCYPELAGFVQPLAGEFAARRELLDSMPFFTGYGAKIGLLIDIFSEVGLAGMAQVDLGTRQNRHQSLANLTRMSSIVLRALAVRDGIVGRQNDGDEPGLWELGQPDTYLHAVATENGLCLDEHLNELIERPPLARLASGTALALTT